MRTDLAQSPAQSDHFIEPAGRVVITVSLEQGVPLGRLLEAQLASFYEQVDLGGPEVVLQPAIALTFATVINELAVNAARYGALSDTAGKVQVHWAVDEQSDPSTLLFLWEEIGGRCVASRTNSGSDWNDIEALTRDLGKPRVDFASGGLKYELRIPLDQVRFRNQREAVK